MLAATAHVSVCFEIVDSRIDDWKIRIQDTIADNASSGLFLLGDDRVDPRKVDFYTCGMVVEKNGEIISTGAGAAALGSPLVCVAWLANTMGAFGIPLEAGEIILSGSLVPLEKVVPGDRMKVTVGGLGAADVTFVLPSFPPVRRSPRLAEAREGSARHETQRRNPRAREISGRTCSTRRSAARRSTPCGWSAWTPRPRASPARGARA